MDVLSGGSSARMDVFREGVKDFLGGGGAAAGGQSLSWFLHYKLHDLCFNNFKYRRAPSFRVPTVFNS